MSIKCSPNPASNVISDHSSDNGLILNGIYVPVELIQNILCYVDAKTLLNCQPVCKNWNKIIRDYVWRRKAESTMACTFSPDASIDWKVFHFICTKNLFGKNLVKNHSGEKGFKYWKVFNNDVYYGGWDRFGGIGSADNDLFGGIDNYHVRRDTDHEEESGRDCARKGGVLEDDNNVEDDDDIDIIFEDDTKSEKSIKLKNEVADGENEDEVESSTEDEDDDLDENDDVNQNDNDSAKGIDNYGFTDEDSQSDCANENSIGTDDENESASGNDASDNEVGYGNSCRGWIVECPPNCAPLLPDEPPFKIKQNCFVTTYYDCYKMYVIDLIKKGFTEYILDHLQPPIEVCSYFYFSGLFMKNLGKNVSINLVINSY